MFEHIHADESCTSVVHRPIALCIACVLCVDGVRLQKVSFICAFVEQQTGHSESTNISF